MKALSYSNALIISLLIFSLYKLTHMNRQKHFLLIFYFSPVSIFCFLIQLISTAGGSVTDANVQHLCTFSKTMHKTNRGTSVILRLGFHQSRLIVTKINPDGSDKISLMVNPNPVQRDLKPEITGCIFPNFDSRFYDISGILFHLNRMDTNPGTITMKNYLPVNNLKRD